MLQKHSKLRTCVNYAVNYTYKLSAMSSLMVLVMLVRDPDAIHLSIRLSGMQELVLNQYQPILSV